MHVVDMQNCTDLTTTYLPISLFFFLLSSLQYDIFCAPLLLLLSSLHVLWVISRPFSNNGHRKENAKAGREKNWVRRVGGKVQYTLLSWPLARLWISTLVSVFLSLSLRRCLFLILFLSVSVFSFLFLSNQSPMS